MGRSRNERSEPWAARVRERRRSEGWSQRQLATLLGRSYRYIERIEAQFIVPPAADRLRLEAELKINPEESAELRSVGGGLAHRRNTATGNVSSPSAPQMLKESNIVYPQKVSWGPANSLPAGVQIWSMQGEFSIEGGFIPWPELEPEMARILLPWVLINPASYRLVTKEYLRKPDWLVWLIDGSGEWFCDVWLGGDPDRNWDFDGLIRFGDANRRPRAWMVFQRYSGGSYRKLHSLGDTLDEIKIANHSS